MPISNYRLYMMPFRAECFLATVNVQLFAATVSGIQLKEKLSGWGFWLVHANGRCKNLDEKLRTVYYCDLKNFCVSYRYFRFYASYRSKKLHGKLRTVYYCGFEKLRPTDREAMKCKFYRTVRFDFRWQFDILAKLPVDIRANFSWSKGGGGIWTFWLFDSKYFK